MGNTEFHEKAYDAGTLAKLRIFELYAQEWIPVFLSQPEPKFKEVHIFDFFCGPGTDGHGIAGSPLRILQQLRCYHGKGMAGWTKVRIVVHLFDEKADKTNQLCKTIERSEWCIPGVEIDCRPLIFQKALAEHQALLADFRIAKLLIIDQFGVDEVTDQVFQRLIRFPTADFIFFLSSSTLHRFRDHPAIKQKIEKPEDSYDVHRAAVNYYRKLMPSNEPMFLGAFSIRKRSNIYGLIFGSHHPLGMHKFLQVAWANDEIAVEANFDIERANIQPGEGILPLDVMRPDKVREFEEELETALRAGGMRSEADVVRFCIEAGRHSAPVLKKLKSDGVIALDFQVPDVPELKVPSPDSHHFMSNPTALVQKLWNYCNILRDDGLSYGDYVEQLTFLLFLKMADEQSRPPFSKPSSVPKDYAWPSLLARDGDELETHYRHVLETLGKRPGMLGVIFRKAQNKIQDPAKLRRSSWTS